ncbi:hypothetical protein Tco_0089357 [Tanacetum coccineum]
MSTPVSTSLTDSQMHNNIMAAGSKDRPPMLGPEAIYSGDHASTEDIHSGDEAFYDSQMHNNIMAAGLKYRPPMLGPARYLQWRSRFLRYIQMHNNIMAAGLKRSSTNAWTRKIFTVEITLSTSCSSASSLLTYNSVYMTAEPGRVFWGADEEIPDGGVPRVIVYGYDGLPMQPVDPPSPDYVPGLRPTHP